MAAELFGEEWARAWGEELSRSEAYRAAAATWEGAMIFGMTPDESLGVGTPRRVLLDLWHGACRAARAVEEDLAEVPYVVIGGPAVWKEVLEGTIEPLRALMSGQLKLARGSVARLLPYIAAARELLAAARRIPTEFPSGEFPARWTPSEG
jgi:putative sterol carrier protein